MDNVFAFKLTMGMVVAVASGAGMLAFAYMKFPASLMVIVPAAAVTLGVVFFARKKETDARFKIYNRTVRDFGQPLFFNDDETAFERNGTRIDVKFPRGKYSAYFRAAFRLPNVGQKFSVQNKTLANMYHPDCRVIEDSSLPPEYLVQSRNPAFLLNLLKNRAIRNEILNYNASFWGKIAISLNEDDFEIIWTPPASEQVDGFYQVCQTAVVFHDELKRISELPR